MSRETTKPALRTAAAGLAGAAMLALAGCVSLLPEAEPVDFYRLTPPAANTSGADASGTTLLVTLPAAARTLGGDRIVVAGPDGTLALAAGAQWVAPSRSMVQAYLVQAFEAAPGAPVPILPDDSMAGDYELALDLRHFEANYTDGLESAPTVRVALGTRLITKRRELVSARSFAAEQRATGNSMSAIVAAFDAATAEISGDLVGWASESVERAQREAELDGGPEDLS